ncbi:hypothetical protein [Leisingera methylohalidivorans]|nr:hypothetical protein [Leisingera methylohalidivorans]
MKLYFHEVKYFYCKALRIRHPFLEPGATEKPIGLVRFEPACSALWRQHKPACQSWWQTTGRKTNQLGEN